MKLTGTTTHIHDYNLDWLGRLTGPTDTYIVYPDQIESVERGSILAHHYEGFGYITPTFYISSFGTWKEQSVIQWDTDATLLGLLFRRHLLKMTSIPVDPYPVYQTVDRLDQSMKDRAGWEGRVFTTTFPNGNLAYRISVPYQHDESRTEFDVILSPKWTKYLMKNRPFEHCPAWPVPSFFVQ